VSAIIKRTAPAFDSPIDEHRPPALRGGADAMAERLE
jgi:hypothetical protein